MKKIVLTLLFLFPFLFLKAQVPVTSKAVAGKFNSYFSAGQPDSIYSLFSQQVKEVLKIEGTRQLVGQIRLQLGGISSMKPEGNQANAISAYRISFEKPLADLMLFIKDGEIAGIRQVPVEEKSDPVRLKSPDNISVKASAGTVYGTLTLPQRTGKVPVVLIIAGSGPTDRNNNQGALLKTNSFLLLSEQLALQGVASVRYDKRGVGSSRISQNAASMSLNDFIEDAGLFIDLLKKDPRFSEVIVLGHSEGSVIGMVSALRQQADAFISVSGPSSDIVTAIGKQLKGKLQDPEDTIAMQIIDSLKGGKTYTGEIPAPLQPLFNSQVQPYLISSLKYNPLTEIARLKIPVLIIGGTGDQQVSAEEAGALAAAAPGSQLQLLNGMNHVLKNTGADVSANLKAYTDPGIPLHEELVPLISSFVAGIH